MAIDDLAHLSDHVTLIAASLELQLRAALPDSTPELGPRLAARIAEAQASIAARAPALELAASRLQRRFGLSETEMHAIWVLSAIAMRADVRALVARRCGSSHPDPTLDVLRAIVYGERPDPAALRELAPTGTLRRYGLIERADGASAEAHETRQCWAVARGILAWLHGDEAHDPALETVLHAPESPIDSGALEVDAGAAEDVREAVARGNGVVVVSGLAGLGRRSLIRACAQDAGVTVLEVDGRKLARAGSLLPAVLRAIARECRLRQLAPSITNLDALTTGPADMVDLIGSELVPLLDADRPMFVTCGVNVPVIAWDRPSIIVEMPPPTSAQRAALWHAALGQGTAEDADHLATAYPLAPALIHRAAGAAKTRAGARAIEADDIYRGIRGVLDDRLGRLARRITVTQTWEDVVLPADQLEAIVELLARIRQRRTVYEQWGFAAKVGKGLGVSALFSGPPGTGKTMVAGMIAKDLGLELFQVDVSKIVSKWIGETEKNLAALFDAAEAGHAILLFDEADALFGKRTDVKSSNDRHANLETNFLLQRLESFTGICLLTSNHESSMDPASQRRLALHVRFDLPDEEERMHLWRAMLPVAAPVAGDVDFQALGRRYAMSGGYIRNAALRAAFLAAEEGRPITTAVLDRAARREYEGMGKLAA